MMRYSEGVTDVLFPGLSVSHPYSQPGLEADCHHLGCSHQQQTEHRENDFGKFTCTLCPFR